MHKRLMLLGFLHDHPLTGYEVIRLVAAHGDLYSDLKKGNVYYLLDRLSREGLVAVKTETGARGPRGERLVYSLTAVGRREMQRLLRGELEKYEPPHSGIDVAIVLIRQLPTVEALTLLRKRLETVDAARRALKSQLSPDTRRAGSAGEHMLMLADTERRWLKRAIRAAESRSEPGVTARSHSAE